MELTCKWCGSPVSKETCEYCNKPIDKEILDLLKITNEYLKDYNSSIRKKILNNEKLSPEEDNKFKVLLQCKRIKVEDLDETNIFYNIFLQNKIISYETFEEFIKVFVEKTMNLVAKDVNPRTSKLLTGVFIKSLDKKGGTTFKHHFYTFDNNEIKELYDGSPDSFITLTHEMFHGIHDLYIKAGKIDSGLMQIIKEEVIRDDYNMNNDNDDYYYKKNYKHIACEVFAQQSAVNMLEYTLKQMNLKVNSEFIEYERNQFDRDFSNQNRSIKVNGEEKIMTVDEIFDNAIISHPEYLKEYPQLNLEYVIEENKVRKKTNAELKETLNSLEDLNAINYLKNAINKKSLN